MSVCPRLSPSPSCPYCNGTGVYNNEEEPFYMNLANGNFRTLWMGLGLNTGEHLHGEIDARTVIQALNTANPDYLIRGTTDEQKMGRCRVISMGTTPDQIERYFKGLREIAEEAAKREEPIVWG